jgi:catechol 2,3-dioxygenase-like lactoylglutathione lyase family enzyme
MPSLRLDHVALPIFTVEASLGFYRDVIGLPLVAAASGDDWGGKPWLMMVFQIGDGRELVLCAQRGGVRPPDGPTPRDMRHVALATAEAHEVVALQRRLADHGAEHWEEDHGTQRSLYFVDPNGIVLELTTPPSESTTHDSDAEAIVRAWLAR